MHGRTGRIAGVFGGLLLLLPSLAGGTAAAGPIRSHPLALAAAGGGPALGPAWARFLAGGPAWWAVARAPRFPSHVRLATWNGRLVETPFVEYLLWRRSLNPARFDHYHPIIGPSLGNLIPPPPPIPPLPLPRPVVPPVRPPIVPPRKPPFNPQPQVPEPGSLAVALILAAAGWGARRRRGVGGLPNR